MKKKDIVILVVAITIAGIILTNVSSKDTILGMVIEPFQEPDWDELKTRDIVKHTIPITLLERNDKCLVTAINFNTILNQNTFSQQGWLVPVPRCIRELAIVHPAPFAAFIVGTKPVVTKF